MIGTAARARKTFSLARGALHPNALFLLTLVAAVVVRLPRITRGLWLDEAWVANSILEKSWHDTFYYPPTVQTSPPLFLAILRGMVHVLPLADLTLRAAPFVLGIAAVALFALWSRRFLPVPAAAAATLLVALSPAAIVYSQEVKPYNSDVFAAVLLLLVSWLYMERPTARRYAALLLTLAIALPLSYQAAFFLPVAICAVLASGERTWRARLARAALLSAAGLLLEAVLYVAFVRPNAVPPSFYKVLPRVFPPHGGAADYVRFYWVQLLNIIALLPVPEMQARLVEALIVAVMLFGALAGLLRRSQKRGLILIAFSLLPLAAVVAANLLGLYPFGNNRLNISLLPCVASCFAFSLVEGWSLIEQLLPKRFATPPPRLVTVVLALLIVLASAAVLLRMNSRRFEMWEDARSAIAYVRAHIAQGDLVYVHASMAEQSKLYLRIWRWGDAPVRFGDTGWPALSRGERDKRFALTNADYAYLLKDFDRVMRDRPPRVWFLHTDRPDHWRFVGRNEAEIISGLLHARGYVECDSPRFLHASAELYRSGGNQTLAASR